MSISQSRAFPFSNKVCPRVIFGDDAFPLSKNLMKPYVGRELTPERVNFNFRLSRARQTSENTFGIHSAKFRIYKQPILTSPEQIPKIVLATVVLHNYLHSRTPE